MQAQRAAVVASADAPQCVPPAQVRAALQRVLESPSFRGASAHQRLLKYLVEHLLAGDADRLKETVLAIEVFQRPAASFDPSRDSIVRVEARRLRQRLARHLGAEGAHEPLHFELPTGQYIPRLVLHGPLAVAAPAADEALELLQRGEFFLRLGHEEGLRKALSRFEEAAQRAPQLPEAHLGVARAWISRVGMTFVPPQPAVDFALRALQRALDLQPQHGEALGLLASVRHRYSLNWAAARELFQRALAAMPGSAQLRHQWAFSLLVARCFDEAQAELRLARQFDPLNPTIRAHEALLLMYRRDYAQAQTRLEALVDLQPQALGLTLLGYLHLLQGQPQQALARYGEVQNHFPELSIGAVGLAQAQALAGQPAQALATLEALRERLRGRYFSPYQEALVRLRLGQTDAVLDLLDSAADGQDANFVCLPVDPAWDALRELPRFRALEQRCGLPGPASGACGP